MVCPRCGSSRRAPDGRCAECNAPGTLVSSVTSFATSPLPVEAGPAFVPALTAASASPFPGESPTAPAAGPLAPGQKFGTRYQIIKLLGSGGMGAVYQAWDEELGVVVALKLIRPDIATDPQAAAEVERRFKRELVLARQVTHKNVVRIHDLGEIGGVKYITMQFVHGQSLAAVLKERGKLPTVDALRIARQVVAGLVAAHEAGVVHRDLKPANIMLGDEDHVYIVDFGIARSAASGATEGVVMGTLEYMTPEQARGLPPDQRVDIYSFGLILLDMLTGSQRTASAGSAMVELMDRMQRAPQSARAIEADVPEGLDQIIARCVQPDPAQRYSTSAELLVDLERLDADGRLVAPLSPGRTVRRPATGLRGALRGQRRALAGTALAVIVLAGGLAAVVMRGGVWRASGPKPGAAGPAATLAVLPFRNASGDPSLDWLGDSLAEMLADDVSRAPAFRVVSNERIFRLLSDLRISPHAVDAATIARVGDLSNANIVVSGEYIKVGGQALRFQATIHDILHEGEAHLTAQASDPNAVADAAQQLARGLLKRADAADGRTTSPLVPTSRSPQAIREYNIGLQFARDARYEGALKHFEAAVAADRTFALAYSKAAEMYANLRQDAEAQRLSRMAVDLAARLPERERDLVDARHARLNNDNVKAIEAYRRVVALSPHDAATRFELGALYETTGSLDEAHSQFEQVLADDPKNLDALVAFGRVEIKRKNPQAALDPLNRALSLAIQFENEEARATILNATGIAYKRLNRPDDALQYYKQSIDIKRRLGQNGGIAATLGEIGQIQQRVGKPEEALTSYQEALAIRRDMGDQKGTASSLIDLGQLYDDRGRHDDALTLYREALQIERAVGDQNYEALCLNNIGGAYLSKGLYAEALTNFERALEIREKMKATADIAQTLHNIGEASLRQGQYDKALKNYVRALELRRTAGDKRATAIDSYSMGTILDYQGRYGAALKAKEDALTVFRQLKDRSVWLAEILNGCGETLGQLGRADEARQRLDEAIAAARELKNGGLIARALNAQGTLHAYGGDWRSARVAFSEALREATRAGAQREMLESELNLAKAELTGGQHQRASAALAGVVDKARKAGLSYVSLDASISLAEARLAAGQQTQARTDLQNAIRRTEESGLLALLARGRYAYGAILSASGQAKDAAREYAEALKVLNQIAEETGTPDLVFKRADFSAMRREAGKWSSTP
jgi:tetratricopeptide (TPR) repeat protein